MAKKYTIWVVIAVIVIAVGAYFIIEVRTSHAPGNPGGGNSAAIDFSNCGASAPAASSGASSSVEYVNAEYCFKVALPADWRGFSIVTSTWQGFQTGPYGIAATGTEISIRNPLWTSEKPYQDIPIMIFTPQQWDDMYNDKFHIGAAPINPSILAYNSQYVFALPARYNFAFPAGYEEVQNIINSGAVSSLLPTSTVPLNTAVLVCAGIPNGSVENVTTTTRLFINIPKEYLPEATSVAWTTVSGNAVANYVSNGGKFGEAFAGQNGCWSYYYELDGAGEVDLSAGNYSLKFLVHDH